MASNAPYWGHLPDPKAGGSQARERNNPPADSNLTAAGRRPSLDTSVQLQPKPNRVSVQTTNTDAPTESTMSPFVSSPTGGTFPDQGLAPRPPSFPYGASRYPQRHQRQNSQDSVERSRRRHSRNNSNYSDDANYNDIRGNQEPLADLDAVDPPPAAPDVPRGPPLSYKPPYSGANAYSYPPVPSSSPHTPRSVRNHDLSLGADPMDIDSPEQYYMTASGAPQTTAQARDTRSRIPVDPNASPRTRRRSVSGNDVRPAGIARQQYPAATGGYAIETGGQRRASASAAGQADRPKKLEDVRSPLQKLELTLDSITKEEKRARVAAAEQIAREREAARGSQRQPSQYPQQQQQQQPRAQPRSQPSTRTQPQRQPQQRSPPQQQQVRFRDQGGTPGEGEPRPLLQPDMSPVEESYFPAAAHRGPLSQHPTQAPPPPPDSEKPRNRQTESRIPVPSSGTPQRSLSFRERAARNNIEMPHADDEPSPTSPGAIPQRQSSTRSAKLKKEPPGDPWFSKRNDAERRFQNVQPRNGLPPGGAPFDAVPGAPSDPPTSYSQGQTARSPPMQAAHGTYMTPAGHSGKLSKSPSQKRTAYGGHVNQAGFDGAQDANRPHYLDAAAAAGAAAGAAAAAGAVTAGKQSPPRRTARFDDDELNQGSSPEDAAQHGVHGAREERHFDDPHHHRISNMVYRARDKLQPGHGTYKPPKYLDEWKKATVGTLSGGLLDLTDEPMPSSPDKDKTWWEKGGKRRGSSSTARPRRAEAFEGEYDETNGPSRFKPPVHLVCGPLLRYCGMRKERSPTRGVRNGNASGAPEREFWRGSVMIVTRDTDSSYDIAPTLRLFVQPLELLPPPPHEVEGALPPEYVDPLVGHPKLGRNGETLYVRPVEHLEEAKDLSRDETDAGLFEKTKSPVDDFGPKGNAVDPPGSFAARLKKTEIDGEKVGKFKDVRGFRLHAERGVTFWRFNIEVELRQRQQRIAYRINRGPSIGFWVPAKDQPMHIMFHSCNGFSLSVDSNQFSGPDPLWRDVLNNHQTQPFHVMIGGGDQLYSDVVMNQTKIFREWLMIKNPIAKGNAALTPEMQDELEAFYLDRYAMWFSQGLFSLANSQIPMVNMYDDHDIIDGYGSYPDHFMSSPVFAGLGNVAFKYYMLFQHQSVITETEESEPSWILGSNPGPYIEELSRSLFINLGAKVALLAVDCRTERTSGEVLKEDTWKRIIDRCYAEIEKGKTEHLLVLLGIPIAYPRLVWLENILTSRLMEPIKLLGRTGIFGNFLNHFDGGVEVLDDLDDHWTAKDHKDERKVVVEDLQDLAADKSVRVTILSGDVHLAAIGQFYSNSKLGFAKHKDFRYMPNIISSAIANAPPPDILADVLNRRNKIHHFDRDTDEDMIPLFGHGVDGKPRNNKRLLPHRNWCSIQPYTPGATPAGTPDNSAYDLTPLETPSGSRGTFFSRNSNRRRGPYGNDPTRPPLSGGILRRLSRGRKSTDSAPRLPGLDGGGVKRSFSLSRPANLLRRLSSRRQRRPDDGGINGSWGPDSYEALPQQQQQQQQQHQPQQQGAPPVPPKVPIDYANGNGHNHGHGHGYRQAAGSGAPGSSAGAARFQGDDRSVTSSEEDIPGAAGGAGGAPRIRGGAGSPSAIGVGAHSYEEFQNGDESYFSVKRRPVGAVRSHTAPEPVYPLTPGTSASDAALGAPHRPFYRTPTGLTAKQLKRAETFEVNLEGGLDIRLNVEVNPKDPTGITVPYRLVVPRLWYTYEGEDVSRGPSVGERFKNAPTNIKRLFSIGQKKPAPVALAPVDVPPED